MPFVLQVKLFHGKDSDSDNSLKNQTPEDGAENEQYRSCNSYLFCCAFLKNLCCLIFLNKSSIILMGSLKNQAYQSRIYSVYDICVRCFLRRGWRTWNDGGISMMYPFMTLNDDTEVTHSEMKEDGRVKV